MRQPLPTTGYGPVNPPPGPWPSGKRRGKVVELGGSSGRNYAQCKLNGCQTPSIPLPGGRIGAPMGTRASRRCSQVIPKARRHKSLPGLWATAFARCFALPFQKRKGVFSLLLEEERLRMRTQHTCHDPVQVPTNRYTTLHEAPQTESGNGRRLRSLLQRPPLTLFDPP
jgi:hypothetical protein